MPGSHTGCGCDMCMFMTLVFKVAFGSLQMKEVILDGKGSLWAKKPGRIPKSRQRPQFSGSIWSPAGTNAPDQDRTVALSWGPAPAPSMQRATEAARP